MAVRAQEAQILKPIVVVDAVNVVEVEGERVALPLGDVATMAAITPTQFEQPFLNSGAIENVDTIGYKDVFVGMTGAKLLPSAPGPTLSHEVICSDFVGADFGPNVSVITTSLVVETKLPQNLR